MKTKLVIFDWAGTLVDFGCRAPLEAFLIAFERKSLTIDEATARRPMGAHKRDHVIEILDYPEIAGRIVGQDPAELTDAIYQEFCEVLAGILPRYASPIPGAVAALQELRSRGIRCAGTTGYTRLMMNSLLPHAEENGVLLDVTVCADEVPHGRPHPDACKRIMKELGGFPPEECVKIGDTVADIREGVNAGLCSLGVSLSGNEVGYDLATLLAMPEEKRDALEAVAGQRLREAGAGDVLRSVAELPQWLLVNR